MSPVTQNIQRLCFVGFLTICSLMGVQCAHVELDGLNPNKFNPSPDAEPIEPKPANPNPFALIDCGSVDSTFSTQIIPLFQNKCADSGCHTSDDDWFSNAAGGLSLSVADDNNLESLTNGPDTPTSLTYHLVRSHTVNNIYAHDSLLLLQTLAPNAGGFANEHADGQTIFKNDADPDFQKLYCWLDGNLENDLDDSDHNFGDDVLPVLTQRCSNCHRSFRNRPLRYLVGGFSFKLDEKEISARRVWIDLISDQDKDGNTPVPKGQSYENTSLYFNPLVFGKDTGTLDSNSDSNGHIFSDSFSDDEKTMLQNWINDGAKAD